ncbi:hypothetical protein ACQY0O_006776 [Thecaphora frezii]
MKLALTPSLMLVLLGLTSLVTSAPVRRDLAEDTLQQGSADARGGSTTSISKGGSGGQYSQNSAQGGVVEQSSGGTQGKALEPFVAEPAQSETPVEERPEQPEQGEDPKPVHDEERKPEEEPAPKQRVHDPFFEDEVEDEPKKETHTENHSEVAKKPHFDEWRHAPVEHAKPASKLAPKPAAPEPAAEKPKPKPKKPETKPASSNSNPVGDALGGLTGSLVKPSTPSQSKPPKSNAISGNSPGSNPLRNLGGGLDGKKAVSGAHGHKSALGISSGR